MFEEIRQADMALATIGWRLASNNVALCDRQEPGLGMQIHTLDQFESSSRKGAESHFGFATPVAVEGVVPNSPADRAGLRADDSLVRVGSVAVSQVAGKPGSTDRLVAAQLALAALPIDTPIVVEAVRAGKPVRVTVNPVPICKSRFELRLASDFRASADGSMVQISSAFLDTYSREQVAAAVAHELSHNILHHRDRLDARGVNFGMLSGFGGSVKYFRQTEIQADLLSVYLLANAGYDPNVSIAFWKAFGPSKAGGIFRTRSHPHWRDRVRTLLAEIGKIAAHPERPIVPGLIAQRDQPLDGDWQSLLIRQ
ncbi:M48 family metalloprotease [Sphingomonas sp. S2-65]|uniref:M48 family metalloprotease n=1 Tax=Sphingomonas sp. S2-65 TaxID=2903960 RepID=UPI001F40E01E|nr:M48 family metalloprotease [Sphingomonas sp. S2-65]UYY58529.1 PDZ domain-containing protein [Sphingomonas sp. S2-65]